MGQPGHAAMKRLLVVDDDPDIRLGLRALFEDRYDVVVARDGGEALRLIEDDGIDVMVLDLMMPAMDGPGLLAALDVRGIRIPAVVVSAFGDVRQRVSSEHGLEFVAKPFDVDELEAKIGRALCRGEDAGGGPARGGGAG